MAKRFNVSKAGDLIALSYEERLGPRIKKSLDRNGVQAYFLFDKTLVIPGSNEVSDYTDFNLRLRKVKHTDGRKYHNGFVSHAKQVLKGLEEKSLKPVRITGQSRGAASAQSVGSNVAKPTMGVAERKWVNGTELGERGIGCECV